MHREYDTKGRNKILRCYEVRRNIKKRETKKQRKQEVEYLTVIFGVKCTNK
jgi:hypothetical protein